MYLNVFLKTVVLLRSSGVWTSGFGDVMLLFWRNLDLKDETLGGFIEGDVGAVLKGAVSKLAPLSRAILTQCHSRYLSCQQH